MNRLSLIQGICWCITPLGFVFLCIGCGHPEEAIIKKEDSHTDQLSDQIPRLKEAMGLVKKCMLFEDLVQSRDYVRLEVMLESRDAALQEYIFNRISVFGLPDVVVGQYQYAVHKDGGISKELSERVLSELRRREGKFDDAFIRPGTVDTIRSVKGEIESQLMTRISSNTGFSDKASCGTFDANVDTVFALVWDGITHDEMAPYNIIGLACLLSPELLKEFTDETNIGIEKFVSNYQWDTQSKNDAETVLKWVLDNRQYMYFHQLGRKMYLDNDARKAGIPTAEYRKTNPWGPEEGPNNTKVHKPTR